MKKVKSINVCTQYKMDMHNVNGNESTSPKNVNGRNYISGQKIRFMLLETIKELSNNNVQISTSDGVQCDIANDLRSDLAGYMNTSEGNYASRRTSPLQVGFALATKQSNYFEDLFVRFKTNPTTNEQNKQRINDKTYSESDIFNFNYMLDCSMLSTSEYFTYDKEKFVERMFIKHVSEKERKNRANLFLMGTSYLKGLANQSRNAVDNKAKKVFICFDSISIFKKYFEMSDTEKSDLLSDLDKRNIPYFIGGEGESMGVNEAYEKACQKLDILELEDYSKEILTQDEVKAKYSKNLSLDEAETKSKKKKENSESENVE